MRIHYTDGLGGQCVCRGNVGGRVHVTTNRDDVTCKRCKQIAGIATVVSIVHVRPIDTNVIAPEGPIAIRHSGSAFDGMGRGDVVQFEGQD